MNQVQTVIATWLTGVLEQFAALGIGVDTLSDGAWLQDACQQAPTRQLHLVAARRLWQQGAQRSGDPLLGLKVGASLPLQAMNVVALLVMQSASLRQALALTIRYQSLVSNSGRFTIRPLKDGLRVGYQVRSSPVSMHFSQIDSVFAGYLSLLRHCAPRATRPRLVALPSPHLQLRPAYETAFGCPVALASTSAFFEFGNEALDRPFLAADPQLLRLAQTRADEMLKAQGHAESLIDHVQAALATQGVGAGDCAQLARSLGLSTRTLQRRLSEAGTNFRRQAEAARMNQALRLLADPTLPLSSLCEQLGYSEPSALSHAIRSYWGASPSSLRAELSLGLPRHRRQQRAEAQPRSNSRIGRLPSTGLKPLPSGRRATPSSGR